MTDIARYYRDAQRSFVELFQSLDADEHATPVPCTPEWTVRDVLSHVAGVTDDIVNGRVDGAATDPWTASQVERWRDADPAMLIEQWNAQIDGVAELLEKIGEIRPVADVNNHEHDVRHAVGRPGGQQSELVLFTAERFAQVPCARRVAVTYLDGTTTSIPGDGEPISLSGLTQFEFARSRLGRRTREQVAAYQWSEPPGADVLATWFAFGPARNPITELASRWG